MYIYYIHAHNPVFLFPKFPKCQQSLDSQGIQQRIAFPSDSLAIP